MGRQISFISLLLAGAVAVAAQAQEPRGRGRQDPMRDRVMSLFGARGEGMLQSMRRGRIGIVVTLSPDAARDSVGAHVESVTPGGPADRAGLRAGDLIMTMNGVRLGVTDRADLSDFESRPGRRLINLAQRLDPGDTVRLEVRRGGRTQTFAFATGESDIDVIVERLRTPGGLRELLPGIAPGEPPRVRMFAWGGGGVRDLELVRVGPELATNLGVTEGLLVVDVGADTALGLRAGDVIVSIGGRRPASPAHAMRILSTYEASEQVQFEVMRQRRRVTVTGRIPQAEGRWQIQPNSFRMPMRSLRPMRGPMMRGQMRPWQDAPGLRRQPQRRMRVDLEPGLMAPRRVEAET